MTSPKLNPLLFIALNLMLCSFGFGQAYTILPRAKKVIDSTYTAQLKKYEVAGISIAIVDSGQIVYATGYGFANKEKKTAASEHTIYRIGSITKSFTALSILQLQEKGLLNINHSVKEYLPELTISSRFHDSNQLSIRDMLSHVSGLPCDVMNGDFCDAPPHINWLIGELNKQTMMSPKRYMHAYSNVAFGLLGEVIARTGKTTYNNYVQQHIFNPLNMQSSYIDYNEKLAAHYAKGYYHKKELKEPLIRDQAAGMIHSNVLDMAHYVNMFLSNGKGLDISAASIAEMEKDQIADILLPSNYSWGYGLYSSPVMIRKDKDSSVVHLIGHGGDTYAYHADLGFIPELNVGVIILTNTDKGRNMVSASALLKIYLKETRSLKPDFNYKPAGSQRNPVNEMVCSGKDLIGDYNFGPFILHAKNENNMKFKQGPVMVKFSKDKKDPTTFTAKAVLLHVIPIKIKGQELQFVKINDEVYFKSIFTKSKNHDYYAVKTAPVPIPPSWKNKLGNYTITGNVYACTDCPIMNMEGATLKLLEKDGCILMKLNGKTPDMKNENYLNIISDQLCVTGSIGRGTGETVRILDNGNIYFSGYEFRRESK